MTDRGLAGRLKGAIKRKYGSVYRLSKELDGISESTLRNYVNGKSAPQVEVLQRLADTLDVTVGFLMGETESEDAPAPGLYFALRQRGRFRVTGTKDDLRPFRFAMAGLNRVHGIPMPARDCVLGFLLDFDTRLGFTSADEAEELVRRFFPTEAVGRTHGENMAAVLSAAAVAYLTVFGSASPTAPTNEEA